MPCPSFRLPSVCSWLRALFRGELDVDRSDNEIDGFAPEDFDLTEDMDVDGPDLPY